MIAADAWLAGFATALAEMHGGLIAAGRDEHLVRVAVGAGLTLAEARRVGVTEHDVDRLKRAGVEAIGPAKAQRGHHPRCGRCGVLGHNRRTCTA